ncbi:MAG: murein biosynthesis integral membrane protein MurJ [Candidatus Omnitrophica bacterium]|nr:murein biosynthesis integral membrane protein MurJ [Candidatus Omnitrophota bacterium]
MRSKIIKNTYILGTGTLISRILGFVRDILIASFFGTSGLLEAFLVSFRLPNIFRSVFAEGFSDSVATPVLSEYQEDHQQIFKLGNHLLSLFCVILLICTILGIIFAKFLVMLIAPGFISQVFKFNLAVSFTRITFIYLFLIGLSSVMVSVLYSLKKFFIPAINPIFLNISFILGIVFFSQSLKNYILIICVIVAGILQLIFPYFSLRRQGFRFRFSFAEALKNAAVLRMFKLFIPRAWSSIVYHLSVFIDTIFSSLTVIVGSGALASVYYANRLIQFPFAIIALSISRVAIVDLSSYHSQGKSEDFKELFVFSFQNIIFFIIPLSVIFLFIPEAIINIIFTRGAFDSYSLAMTSSVLFFYSFGLFFFCGIKLLVNSFYSLKDTVLPAKTATFSLIVNVILSSILMFPLKIGGVALGSSLAAICNFFLLYYFFKKRIGPIDWQDTRSQLLKVLSLSLVVGLLARFLWYYSPYNKYLNALVIIVAVAVVFFGGGYLVGLRQIRHLKVWISAKK